MKLTEWYPAHIKPVRVGWYDTLDNDGSYSQLRWYFDGRKWCWFHDNDIKKTKVICVFQKRPWRGLAQKP